MFDRPFTTSEALVAGMTRGQLRGRRWRAPFSGVRIADTIPIDLLSQCHALQRILPRGAVFSGITAARLRGWWLPRGAETLPIDVTLRPDQLVERPGVRCHRSELRAVDIVDHDGVPLTTGLRTLTDLAAGWSLLDLVVMADCALRLGHCSPTEWATVGTRRGGRGVRVLRRAATLTDRRSDSPMETLLRLAIVLSSLPAPTPQAILRDAAGGWLAQVDLLAPNGRSIFEYDGANHNGPQRHASDVSRWRVLTAAGFEVFPYTARDLYFGAAQIVLAYQRAMNLPPDADAVEGWLREWRLSSFAQTRGRSRFGP